MTESTIQGAGKGLFTTKGVPSGKHLCLYEGERLVVDTFSLPEMPLRYDYIWANSNEKVIIDAYVLLSCRGRFVNDPIDE